MGGVVRFTVPDTSMHPLLQCLKDIVTVCECSLSSSTHVYTKASALVVTVTIHLSNSQWKTELSHHDQACNGVFCKLKEVAVQITSNNTMATEL